MKQVATPAQQLTGLQNYILSRRALYAGRDPDFKGFVVLNKSSFKILAIETSCDETAAAVIEKTSDDIKILSNVVSSQINIHRKFGGVFPEYASRAHSEKIIPVVSEALGKNKPDVVAVTLGPGLIGSLLVGVNFAKTYAYTNSLSIIGINHLAGHLYSNWADKPFPQFPAIILIVSGGHTGLYLMKSHTNIQTLGETLDDAAGEAFDKVAKLLQLGYPGGPAIAKAASKFSNLKFKISNEIQNSNFKIDSKFKIKNLKFPRSMLNSGDYNFSFSGLKTAVLYKVRELQSQRITINHGRQRRPNHYQSLIAYEFQQTVIDILIGKTIQAAREFKPKSICLCGGVAANKELRKQMAQRITQSLNHVPPKAGQITLHVPPMELTTDNAAMIGIAAAYQNPKKYTSWDKVHADANLRL